MCEHKDSAENMTGKKKKKKVGQERKRVKSDAPIRDGFASALVEGHER